MVGLPVQHSGPTGKMHEHYRFAKFGKLEKQVVLRIGHLDVHTRGALAAHLAGFAHGGNDHIRLTGNAQRLGTHSFGTTRVAHLAAEHRTDSLRLSIVHQVGSFGIQQPCTRAAQGVLQSLTNGFVPLGYSRHSPCARHVRTRIRQRTDQCYRAAFVEREKPVVVLEQHHTFAGYASCHGAVRIAENDRLAQRGVAVAVRVVEQTEFVLRLKHPTAGCVHLLHAAATTTYGISQRHQPVGHHIHIQPGIQALDSALLERRAYAVLL